MSGCESQTWDVVEIRPAGESRERSLVFSVIDVVLRRRTHVVWSVMKFGERIRSKSPFSYTPCLRKIFGAWVITDWAVIEQMKQSDIERIEIMYMNMLRLASWREAWR